MNHESIKLTMDGEHVARLTLARPDIQHAMSMKLVQESRHALRVIEADDKPRAVVLTGEGKSFCAGGDFRWSDELLREAGASMAPHARTRSLNQPPPERKT